MYPMKIIVCGAAAFSLAVAPLALSSADAAPAVALVRVAHLSPKVGPVDVMFVGPTSDELRGSTYGEVSAYQRLAPGTYRVEVRPAKAGNAMTTVSWGLTVKAGAAYTLAAVGRPGHQITEVFNDATTAAPADSARLRVIQGAPAARTVSITAVGGGPVITGLHYGAATGYASVAARTWRLRVTEDGQTATATVTPAAGHSYSLVVEQIADGAIPLLFAGRTATGVAGLPVSIAVVDDATGESVAADPVQVAAMPMGAADTGTGSGPHRDLAVGGLAIVLLAAALGGAALRRRR
jgi:hypothetical protein